MAASLPLKLKLPQGTFKLGTSEPGTAGAAASAKSPAALVLRLTAALEGTGDYGTGCWPTAALAPVRRYDTDLVIGEQR